MREIDDTRQGETWQRPLPMEDVERLVDLVRESGVGEIRVRQGEVEITVKARPEAPDQGLAPAAGLTGEILDPESSPERDGLHIVRSPLVGTFYRAPAPGEDAYVEEIGRASCRERV